MLVVILVVLFPNPSSEINLSISAKMFADRSRSEPEPGTSIVMTTVLSLLSFSFSELEVGVLQKDIKICSFPGRPPVLLLFWSASVSSEPALTNSLLGGRGEKTRRSACRVYK